MGLLPAETISFHFRIEANIRQECPRVSFGEEKNQQNKKHRTESFQCIMYSSMKNFETKKIPFYYSWWHLPAQYLLLIELCSHQQVSLLSWSSRFRKELERLLCKEEETISKMQQLKEKWMSLYCQWHVLLFYLLILNTWVLKVYGCGENL